MAMDNFTMIKDITETNDDGTLSITATVKSISKMKSWNRNKINDHRYITRQCGSIDCVCWTESAHNVDQDLDIT